MADETYVIDIQYSTNADAVTEDFQDLGDEIENFEELQEDVGRTGEEASRQQSLFGQSIRDNALPILTGTALIAGFTAALGSLAFGSASVRNIWDTLTAGVSRFIDAAVGPELDEAATNISRLIAAATTVPVDPETGQPTGEPSFARRLAEQSIFPGGSSINDLIRASGQGAGEIADFLEDPQGHPITQGFNRVVEFDIAEVLFGRSSREVLGIDTPVASPGVESPSGYDPAQSSSDVFRSFIDSRAGERTGVIPPVTPQATGYPNVQITVGGSVIGVDDLDERIRRALRTTITDPTTRGSALTGGALP